MPKRIFIGYRRGDTLGTARVIYERLRAHYGGRRLFFDTEEIEPGENFVERIEREIEASDVVLILVGKDWATIEHPCRPGARRLFFEDDPVRAEVELALHRGDAIKLLPVLVDGESMPERTDLPESIRALVSIDAVTIRGERVDEDVARLIDEIGGVPRPRAIVRSHPVVSSIAFVFAALIVGFGVNSVLDGGPGPLDGDFNIGVAEFDAIGEDGPSAVNGLADEAYRDIVEVVHVFEEQGDLTRLAVGGPGDFGTIEGSTPQERAAAAEALAVERDVDVLLYGTLDAESGGASFVAEFFLRDRNLRNAEELAGSYTLGTVELATSDPIAIQRAVTDALERRAVALAELAIGLSYYATTDYPEAEAHFESALTVWEGPVGDEAVGSQGKEVLLHMLGNVSGLRSSEERDPALLDKAYEYYQMATDIDSGYARSRFGLAEVKFLRAGGTTCGTSDQPTDLEVLEETLSEFMDVLVMKAPPLSYLDVRTAAEIGQVYLCQSLAGLDRLDLAEAQLLPVVDLYDGENERLRPLAEEAQQTLGRIEMERGNYDGALERFAVAIDLTVDPSREAFYRAVRAWILECALRDVEAADREFDRVPDAHPPQERIECVEA